MITQYNLEYSEAFTQKKTKAEQRDNRAASSFSSTPYTPDDGQLGRNM
jgi:hypothetical protein